MTVNLSEIHISLGEFERRHNIAKGTISKRAREMGFDTSEGLSPTAYAAMKTEFKVSDRPAAAPQPQAQAQHVPVTIETGNHCTALATPEMAGTFSLERFRADDVTALIFNDPLAVADDFLAISDRLVTGMDADIRAREERLQKTREAQGKVAAKAQELKLESRLYRDRTRDLDMAQTAETRALQDAVVALQSLGKPDGQDARGGSQP
jgi:hypothetical protein